MKISIEKCHPDAVLPTYAHDGDAGMDLYAVENTVIDPGQTALVRTGLKMAIPYGYEVQIRPRSGISYKTLLRIPNAPGTIDCGYRDEVCVIMHNASDTHHHDAGGPFTVNDKGCKHGTYKIHKGDRIAQMVVAKVEYAELETVDDVTAIGDNRGGGFGSTGTK